MAPAPGAFTMVGKKRLRLARVRAVSESPGGAPGTVHVAGGVPLVATGSGAVEIVAGQLEGKREVLGKDLVNGRVLAPGVVLGAE